MKEVKEVQKSTRKYNLYLTVYSLLKQGLNPSKICKKLNIKKQSLNYYLSSLKRSGCIEKVGYGVWEIRGDLEVKEVQKSTRNGTNQLELLNPDEVRGHAFMFKLKLPSNLRNWDKREEILGKLNIKFNALTLGGLNRGQKINFKGRKIWLTNNSIIIHEKESYIAETAQEAKDYAIADLISLVKALERKLRGTFSFGGQYKFKVSRQHYSLIKNALAKQYNREGKKLEIYNSSGLWFLIDNSFNLNEAETVHPKTAVKDNEKVQNFFNGLKEQEGYTPAFIVTSIAKNSENLENYAVHLKSHVQSVKDLGDGVKELVKTIKELKK